MRYRRQELALIGELLLDPCRHLVDRLGERADLPGLMPAEAHAALQLSLADLPGDGLEIAKRPPQTSRHRERREPEGRSGGGKRQEKRMPAAPVRGGEAGADLSERGAARTHDRDHDIPRVARGSCLREWPPRRIAQRDAEIQIARERAEKLGPRRLVVPHEGESPRREGLHASELVAAPAGGAEEQHDPAGHRSHEQDGQPEPPEEPPMERRSPKAAAVVAMPVRVPASAPRTARAHGSLAST